MAALRAMADRPLYAALNIFGLMLGIVPALLVVLFIKHEFSYDRSLPNHDNIYLLGDRIQPDGKAAYQFDTSPANFADKIKLNYPEVHTIARIASVKGALRKGDVEGNDDISWADPDVFSILKFPVIAGNLADALRRPDGIVLSRAAAEKYFGAIDVIGQSLELDRAHVLVVTAVLEDLPSNSNFKFDAIASGSASFSRLATLDAAPPVGLQSSVYTFIRFQPAADVEKIQAGFKAFLTRVAGDQLEAARAAGTSHTFSFISLMDLHLTPNRVAVMRDSANMPALYTGAGVAVLIVIAAVFNFVNLATCRTSLRAVEVGVRKVSGAGRGDLILQFLGEAAIYAGLGTGLAALLIKVLTPALAAFLLPVGVSALDQSADWCFWIAVAGFAIVLTILAGAYPAFVMGNFRPTAAFKSQLMQTTPLGWGRQFLVVLQFSILILLLVATLVAFQQVNLTRDLALRYAGDQIVLVRNGCRDGFKTPVMNMAGVQQAACASAAALNLATVLGPVRLADGAQITAAKADVDFGLLEIFGKQPVAGRFFAPDYGEDTLPMDAPANAQPSSIVINETAVRKFGFATPENALGSFVRVGIDVTPSKIVGVAPDFAFDQITYGIQPVIYLVRPKDFQFLVVKLATVDVVDTLDAMSQVWKTTGGIGPLDKTFLDQRIAFSYLGIRRQSETFSGLAGMTLFISALGLFGLSAFTAEQRTKEIGIRKALGAHTSEVLALLIWQSSKPALLANVIALPLAYLGMRRWLEGFAYHIDLEPWIFLTASTIALAIAVFTVATHAWLVARTQPVHALRYE